MLLMTGTTDLVRVVTDAAGDIEPHVSFLEVENSTGNVTSQRTNTTSITTATTTTIVASPASGFSRNIKHINLRNNHASQAVLVTVFHTDGTTQEDLMEVTLLAGEALILNQAGTWIHYDVNGGMYPQVGAIASQAEMEAGTSLTTTVSPGRAHFHPSALKAWGKSNGAGTSLLVNYNISSLTDTGTGRLGVNIGTDFSSANYSITASVERSVTALTATGVEDHAIRNASPTAGVFEIESYDQTAILFAAQDPANYFWQVAGDQA